jgi:DNA-binding transcriptional ArsR family regulator
MIKLSVVNVQDQERERAEVFDALGHPTRIDILRLLSHGPVGFADLKKRTGIESSGHLQHHLAKLDGLIRTDEHGNYCLSDAGNDALFTMQTVEVASRKRKSRFKSESRKSKILLSALVVALGVCLVASALYLSNTDISLNRTATQTLNTVQNVGLAQYAAQNQYVCDVMTGSLRESGGESIGPYTRSLAPQEWFNYTVVALSESNYSGYGYILPNASTLAFPSPVKNDTYYSQGFLKFDLQVIGLNPDDLYHASVRPIIGPNGWNGEVVRSFPYQELPPYPAIQTSTMSTPDIYSGGAPISFESIIPINTFGNYTFCVINDGNNTLQVSATLTKPSVTVDTRPLTVGSYAPWSPDFAEERIVRIRQESGSNQSSPATSTTIPDTTLAALTTAVFDVSCAVTLATMSIFAINRKKTLQTEIENANRKLP